MKVLYVIDSLAPAGAETSLAELAPLMSERGIDLQIVTLYERNGLAGTLRDAGVPVRALSVTGRAHAVRAVRRSITSARPDLVHTTLFESDLAGRIAAASTRTRVASSLVNEAYGPAQVPAVRLGAAKVKVARALDLLSARVVTRFHAVSEHVAGVMAERLHIDPERIEVIPRGRVARPEGRYAELERTRARESLGVAPGEPLVLAVARHARQKGLDVLLAAAADLQRRMPAVRFVVAGGEGPETASLEAARATLPCPERFTFLGRRDDVPALLGAADAFAFPSRWEGLPGAVLEAMGAGVPIVATAVPSIREAVGEAAVLVPAEDAAALAAGLELTLTDANGAAARAGAARRRFNERFSLDRVADRMADFYRRAGGVSR